MLLAFKCRTTCVACPDSYRCGNQNILNLIKTPCIWSEPHVSDQDSFLISSESHVSHENVLNLMRIVNLPWNFQIQYRFWVLDMLFWEVSDPSDKPCIVIISPFCKAVNMTSRRRHQFSIVKNKGTKWPKKFNKHVRGFPFSEF